MKSKQHPSDYPDCITNLWEEVEAHIWLLRQDTQDYPPGWYFCDETSDFHGPFSTREEACDFLRLYVENL